MKKNIPVNAMSNKTIKENYTVVNKENYTIIDLGNKEIKVIAPHKPNLSFENRVCEFGIDEQVDTFNENTVIYDNKLYLVATKKATLDARYIKTEKNFIAPILYTCGGIGDVEKTNLMLCLPNDQIENKTVFEEQLANKTFKCEVNNKKKNIKIGKVLVVRESQAAFFSLPAEDRRGLSGTLDAGSYTINVFIAENGKEVSSFTIQNFGITDYFRGLAETLSKYRKLNDVEAERYLDILREEYAEEIQAYTSKFCKDLYNVLLGKFSNIEFHNLVMTGGNTYFIFDELSKYLPKLKKHTSPIFANAEGCKKILEIKKLI